MTYMAWSGVMTVVALLGCSSSTTINQIVESDTGAGSSDASDAGADSGLSDSGARDTAADVASDTGDVGTDAADVDAIDAPLTPEAECKLFPEGTGGRPPRLRWLGDRCHDLLHDFDCTFGEDGSGDGRRFCMPAMRAVRYGSTSPTCADPEDFWLKSGPFTGSDIYAMIQHDPGSPVLTFNVVDQFSTPSDWYLVGFSPPSCVRQSTAFPFSSGGLTLVDRHSGLTNTDLAWH